MWPSEPGLMISQSAPSCCSWMKSMIAPSWFDWKAAMLAPISLARFSTRATTSGSVSVP